MAERAMNGAGAGKMDVADQNRFVLPKEKWKSFLEALDRPPKAPAGLTRLFSRPSIAESR